MNSLRRPWTERRPTGIIALTGRDHEIIRALARFRFLTSSQLSKMFFGSKSKCDRRLRQLFDHGYIDRIPRPAVQGKSELIYALWKLGADHLMDQDDLSVSGESWSPSRNRLKSHRFDHELGIVEMHLAMDRAIICRPGLSWLFWHDRTEITMRRDWHLAVSRRGNISTMKIIPDAFCGLQTPKGKTIFCLEIDRGTESGAVVLTRKFQSYELAYAQNHVKKLVGVSSFRVLTIVHSQRRLENLLRLAVEMPNSLMFWFSTTQSLQTGDVLREPIWRYANGAGEYVSLLDSDPSLGS